MPTRQDKTGRWHADACVGRLRLHRRLPPGASASDAKLLAAELTKALHAKAAAHRPGVPGNPLLSALMADYTERHAFTLRSPKTAQHHAYRIGKWIDGKRASDTRHVVAKIVQDLGPAYAPATINRSLGALKKALHAGFERGDVAADYSGLVKRLPENNEREVYLTIEQVRKLADHASEPVKAAIWIALLTGCRRGEILAIKPADIGPDTITLPSGNTKMLRTRTVPIVPALRPWLQFLPIGINYEGVKSGFRRARQAANMPHVHFHDLRHSCASILLASGADLHTISKILGHSSSRSTERYAHMQVAQQRRRAGTCIRLMVGGAGFEPATPSV